MGEILPNFNSATKRQEAGRHEVHDYSDNSIFKSLQYFRDILVDLNNQYGGDENKALTGFRTSLFKKYQDIVASAEGGITLVTAENIR